MVKLQKGHTEGYEPNITDAFETIHVTTQFPDPAHAAGVDQVEVQYDLPQ